FFEHQLERRQDQEQAEDVKHPAEMGNGGPADEDENSAQDQGDDNTHQQHFLLVDCRHGEARHDEHEHEQVVDRQAVFGDVTGEVFESVIPTPDQAQSTAEYD